VRIRVPQLPPLLGVEWYAGNVKKNGLLMADKLGVKAVVL
jgi:hypothetical protein